MIQSFFIIALISIVIIYNNHIALADDESATYSLLEATNNHDLRGVRLALKDGNEDINVVNDNGWTAATFAAATGNIDILKVLIENGIDLNIANNEGYTPLMVAAAEVSNHVI